MAVWGAQRCRDMKMLSRRGNPRLVGTALILVLLSTVRLLLQGTSIQSDTKGPGHQREQAKSAATSGYFGTSSALPNEHELKPLGNSPPEAKEDHLLPEQQGSPSTVLLSRAAPIAEDATHCRQLQCSKVGQFSYWIRSGGVPHGGPLICVNGEIFVDPQNPATFSSGINLVVVNAKLRAVMDYRSFDTSTSLEACLDLTRYLSFSVPPGAHLLLASHGDASARLCSSTKKLLAAFGSKAVNDIATGDSWTFVGKNVMWNLDSEESMIKKTENQEFANTSHLQGCRDNLGSVTSNPVGVDFGLSEAQCGMLDCLYDEISVYISTGWQSSIRPTVCIAGSYVVSPGLKSGTGFHLVAIEPLTRQTPMVRHFDTYTVESSGVDLLLESIGSDMILVGVVHDDAATGLKNSTLRLLEDFGIDMAKELRFRSVMYFVGRRGLKSSRYQEISHKTGFDEFPQPISKRFCIPSEITDRKKDDVNHQRKYYCDTHPGYGDFCYKHHSLQPLQPAPAAASIVDSIYQVPIVVVAGFNHLSLTHTLRSLLAVPGLVCSRVTVVYATYFAEEYKDLIQLFGFQALDLGVLESYPELLERALSTAWREHALAPDYLIVIEEEVTVAPSFLQFMQQALQFMKTYPPVRSASAWNPNGFNRSAASQAAAYYSDEFIGVAFLMRRDFYEERMRGRMKQCCSQRPWQGWFRDDTIHRKRYLVSAVSHADLQSIGHSYLSHQIKGAGALAEWRHVMAGTNEALPILLPSAYGEAVASSLQRSIDITSLAHQLCSLGIHLSSALVRSRSRIAGEEHLLGAAEGSTLAVVYKQEDPDDYRQLLAFCRCLDLACVGSRGRPLGLFQGLFRFSIYGKDAYLVGSLSHYYRSLGVRS